MAFAAYVSKPKTISKTRAGSSRTVGLKEHLTKAMNVSDGISGKTGIYGAGGSGRRRLAAVTGSTGLEGGQSRQ